MADIISPAARSAVMSKIRGGNTAPEMTVRRLLFSRGLRYQLHRKDLPGKPDLVFPRFKAVIFVHGCFWHAHGNGCHLSKRPSSNTTFWDVKLNRNLERDREVRTQTLAAGWRICTVWECSIRGRRQEKLEELADTIQAWLHSEEKEFETDPVNKEKR